MNADRREKYNKMIDATYPLRKAKTDTIHKLGKFGRKHKILKWPVFVLLVAFIFVYNFFYYLFINLHIREKLSRGLALAMTLILVISSIDMAAFAIAGAGDKSYYLVNGVSCDTGRIEVKYGTKESKIALPTQLLVNASYYEQVNKDDTLAIPEISDNSAVSEDSFDIMSTSQPDVSVNEIEELGSDVDIESDEISNTDINNQTVNSNEVSDLTETPDSLDNADNTNTDTINVDTINVGDSGNANSSEENENTQIVLDDNLVSYAATYRTGVVINTNDDINDTAPVCDDNGDYSDSVEKENANSDDVVVNYEENSVIVSDEEDGSSEEYVLVSTEDILMDVRWVSENYDRYTPGEYVFTAVLPDKYNRKDVRVDASMLPSITVEVLEANSVILTTVVDDVEITVEADPGVFPEDVTLLAEKVEDINTLNVLDEQIDAVREEDVNVSGSYAFDIKILEDGTEIQPDNTAGSVRVLFRSANVSNEILETEVYHIHEDATGIEAENLDTNVYGSVVMVSTDSFSYYVVEFTYETLEYKINEIDGEVVLSDILSALNITGTITNVEVSDGSKLSIAAVEGNWKIKALEVIPKDAPQTLTVIVDDNTYVINVFSGLPVTFGNNGYPYGKNMSTSQITIACDVASGTADTYQWYSSDAKDGTYSAIEGAVSSQYTFSPNAQMWILCEVNGVSRTQPVYLINGSSSNFTNKCYNFNYYISNGSIAYAVGGSVFDVVGKYTKNGTTYWLQTSYGGNGWSMAASGDANPRPLGGYSGSYSGYEYIKVAFSDEDEFFAQFEVKPDANTKAFGFGCDTMLGNSNTSGYYSDSAALVANIDKGKLYQVVMIGNASQDEANDDDPSFVIKPVTKDNVTFWIGGYSSRQYFAFNNSNDGYYSIAENLNGQLVTTQVNRTDSGMTMSWLNIRSGSVIRFSFGAGSVANTGAKIKAMTDVTSTSITVLNPEPGFYYGLFTGGDNPVQIGEWILVDENTGDIVYENLEKDTEYIVKVIDGNSDFDPETTENVDEFAESTETSTAIDPLDPKNEDGEEKPATTITAERNYIIINNASEGYSYRLEDELGNSVTDYIDPGEDLSVRFDGLESGVTYKLVAKSPTNDISDRVDVTTKSCQDAGGCVACDALDEDMDFEWVFDSETGEAQCYALVRCKYNHEHILQRIPCDVEGDCYVNNYDDYDYHYCEMNLTATCTYNNQNYSVTNNRDGYEYHDFEEVMVLPAEVLGIQLSLIRCKVCGYETIHECGIYCEELTGVESIRNDRELLSFMDMMFSLEFGDGETDPRDMDFAGMIEEQCREDYGEDYEDYFEEAYEEYMDENGYFIDLWIDIVSILYPRNNGSGGNNGGGSSSEPSPTPSFTPIPTVEPSASPSVLPDENPITPNMPAQVPANNNRPNANETPTPTPTSVIDITGGDNGPGTGKKIISEEEAANTKIDGTTRIEIGEGNVDIYIGGGIETSIPDASEIIDNVLSEEEMEAIRGGANVVINIDVDDKMEEPAPDSIIKQTADEIVSDGQVAFTGSKFSIDFTKQVDGGDVQYVKRTDGTVNVTISVPESMNVEGSVYCVVSSTGEVYEVTAETIDGQTYITFATDNFEDEYSLVTIMDEGVAYAAGLLGNIEEGTLSRDVTAGLDTVGEGSTSDEGCETHWYTLSVMIAMIIGAILINKLVSINRKTYLAAELGIANLINLGFAIFGSCPVEWVFFAVSVAASAGYLGLDFLKKSFGSLMSKGKK